LTCDGKPIDAHSIQNAKVLELIQTDGHVLMPDFRLVNGEPKLELVKIGRNDASTFTGLCSKHDTELFKAIDTEPLDVDNCEHLRQLAYRSVMREFHTHLLNSEQAWAIHEQFCKAGGADPAEVATAASILALNHDKKAFEVLNYRKKQVECGVVVGHQRAVGKCRKNQTAGRRQGCAVIGIGYMNLFSNLAREWIGDDDVGFIALDILCGTSEEEASGVLARIKRERHFVA